MNIFGQNRLRSRAQELCPQNPSYPRSPRFAPFFVPFSSNFPPDPSKFLRFSAIFREPKKYFPTPSGSFSTIPVEIGVPSKRKFLRARPSSRRMVAKTLSHPRLSLVRHQLSLFELRSRRRFARGGGRVNRFPAKRHF